MDHIGAGRVDVTLTRCRSGLLTRKRGPASACVDAITITGRNPITDTVTSREEAFIAPVRVPAVSVIPQAFAGPCPRRVGLAIFIL